MDGAAAASSTTAPPPRGAAAPPAPGSRRAGTRWWPAGLALALLVVLLVRLAFDAGGYFPAAHLEAGAIALAAVAILVVVEPGSLRPAGETFVAVAGLAAYAAWTLISTAWSPTPDEGLVDFQRTLAYVGILALAIVASGSGRHARLLPWAALAVCVVVCGSGLLGRLLPETFDTAPELIAYRLSRPLTYWNAMGGLAAFGTVLAAGLASDPRLRPALRALGAAAAVPLAVTMYLSLSRGSWLALIAGAACLLLFSPYRISVLLTGGVVGVAVALLLARLTGLEALVDDPRAGPGPQEQGEGFLPLLLAVTVAAAGAQLAIAQARSSVPLQDLATRVRAKALLALGVVVLGVGVVGYAVAGDRAEGRSANALDDASDWVSRQWDDFLLTSQLSTAGRERLTTAKGTRSELYRVALEGFGDHPLLGDGAGSFEWRWAQQREIPEETREAHSLWLGTLSELGLVGALALAAFVGAFAAAAWRGLRRPGGMRRGETAAVTAAGVVWLVHSATDWDWQMPAFTGTVILACAALLPLGRVRRRRMTIGGAGGS